MTKITNFNPSTDTLEIDTDSFGIDSSATFAAGKNKKAVKKKLAKQDFDFLYDEKKGGLYFNENGADKGFGDGGIIAILKGAPDLTRVAATLQRLQKSIQRVLITLMMIKAVTMNVSIQNLFIGVLPLTWEDRMSLVALKKLNRSGS